MPGIEVQADRVRVYQTQIPDAPRFTRGSLVFDLPVANTSSSGMLGLVWPANVAKPVIEISVSDLGAAAPVLYRFSFAASNFAVFDHLVQSHNGQQWSAPVQAASAQTIRTRALDAGGRQEAGSLDAIAKEAIGTKSAQDPEALEVTRVIDSTAMPQNALLGYASLLQPVMGT